MAFISGELKNKCHLLRGTGEQRHYWGTGNIKMFISIFKNIGTSQVLFRGTWDKHKLNLGNMRLKFYCLLEASVNLVQS